MSLAREAPGIGPRLAEQLNCHEAARPFADSNSPFKLRVMFCRVSLRTMFLFITAISVGIVIYERQARVNRVVARLVSRGAKVEYHPGVISKLFGFLDAKVIDLSRTRVRNDDLRELKNLKRVEAIHLHRTSVNHDGIKWVSEVRRLERLSLWGAQRIGDKCVDHLLKLENLRVLDIHDTHMSADVVPRLSKMPALKHLIFTARFASDDERWIDACQGDLDPLTRIRTTPVGKFYGRGFSDLSIQQLKRLDTSRLRALALRDTQVTAVGLANLRGMNLRELDLQSSTVTNEDIRSIPWSEIEFFTIGNSNVTLAGIMACIGEEVHAISLSNDYVKMSWSRDHPPRQCQLRFFPQDLQVDRAAIARLAHLKSFSITRSLEDQAITILGCLADANSQASVSVYFSQRTHDPRLWKVVERLTTIPYLRIHQPPSGAMKFTERHRLRHLALHGENVVISENDFRELGKLTELRSLTINNSHPIGNEIQHLRGLSELRHLRLKGLTEEAMAHLSHMNLEISSR